MSMYQPDPVFVKKLKRYDRNLTVDWAPRISRWQVKYKGRLTGRMQVVLTVEDENGNYRPLDERVITALALMDCARNGGVEKVIQMIEDNDERVRSASRMRLGQETSALVREAYNWIVQKPTSGYGGKTFRGQKDMGNSWRKNAGVA